MIVNISLQVAPCKKLESHSNPFLYRSRTGHTAAGLRIEMINPEHKHCTCLLQEKLPSRRVPVQSPLRSDCWLDVKVLHQWEAEGIPPLGDLGGAGWQNRMDTVVKTSVLTIVLELSSHMTLSPLASFTYRMDNVVISDPPRGWTANPLKSDATFLVSPVSPLVLEMQ